MGVRIDEGSGDDPAVDPGTVTHDRALLARLSWDEDDPDRRKHLA